MIISSTSVGPMGAHNSVGSAGLKCLRLDERDLFIRIGARRKTIRGKHRKGRCQIPEAVDRDDDGHAEFTSVFDVTKQVANALLNQLQMLDKSEHGLL